MRTTTRTTAVFSAAMLLTLSVLAVGTVGCDEDIDDLLDDFEAVEVEITTGNSGHDHGYRSSCDCYEYEEYEYYEETVYDEPSWLSWLY